MENEPKLPTPIVALFPFALGRGKVSARDADLCRGVANFVDRRFSLVNGVEMVLQNFFVAAEENPERRGWLMTNSFWSLDQINGLQNRTEVDFTHALQGQILWRNNQLEASMQLLDLESGLPVLEETASGPQDEAVPRFFQILGRVAETLTASTSIGRIMARRPTGSPPALRSYLLGLAGVHAYHHKLASADVALGHFVSALEADGDFLSAAEEMESFAERCLRDGGNGAISALASLTRVVTPSIDYPRFKGVLGIEMGEAGVDDQRAAAMLKEYVSWERHGELASNAMTMLARIQLRRSEQDAARKNLVGATIACPENAVAWEWLGVCHDADGNSGLARNSWRRALQEDGERSAALVMLARSLHERGDHATALTLLEQLEAREYSLPLAGAILRTNALMTSGQADAANNSATDCAEIFSTEPNAWFSLLSARRNIGDLPGAHYCLEKLAQLTLTREQRHRFERATLEQNFPGDAELMAHMENVEFARLSELADVHARMTVVQDAVASHFVSAGVTNCAMVPLGRLCDLEPEEASHFARMGAALRRQRAYGDALKAYGRALFLDPGNEVYGAALHQVQTLMNVHTSKPPGRARSLGSDGGLLRIFRRIFKLS